MVGDKNFAGALGGRRHIRGDRSEIRIEDHVDHLRRCRVIPNQSEDGDKVGVNWYLEYAASSEC